MTMLPWYTLPYFIFAIVASIAMHEYVGTNVGVWPTRTQNPYQPSSPAQQLGFPSSSFSLHNRIGRVKAVPVLNASQ